MLLEVILETILTICCFILGYKIVTHGREKSYKNIISALTVTVKDLMSNVEETKVSLELSKRVTKEYKDLCKSLDGLAYELIIRSVAYEIMVKCRDTHSLPELEYQRIIENLLHRKMVIDNPNQDVAYPNQVQVNETMVAYFKEVCEAMYENRFMTLDDAVNLPSASKMFAHGNWYVNTYRIYLYKVANDIFTKLDSDFVFVKNKSTSS